MDWQKKLGWTISVAFYEGHLKDFSCFSILFFGWCWMNVRLNLRSCQHLLPNKTVLPCGNCESKQETRFDHFTLCNDGFDLLVFWLWLLGRSVEIALRLESCQCIWHSWLFVSSRSRCWLKGHKMINTYFLFLTEHDFPGILLISLSFFVRVLSPQTLASVVMTWTLSTPETATPLKSQTLCNLLSS